MKKYCKLIVLLFVSCFVLLIDGNNAKASQKMKMNSTLRIEESDVLPGIGGLIYLPTGRHKVRITISNITTSGVLEKYSGYYRTSIPFNNVSTYNNFSFSLDIGYDESYEYTVLPGQNSLVIEATLSTVEDWNNLHYCLQTSKPEGVEGYIDYSSYSFTVLLEDLGYVQTADSTKVGKVYKQEYADSTKCKLLYSVHEGTDKVRIYRKDSSGGKYKLIKTKTMEGGEQTGEKLSFMDKGLKPNKKYWYTISTKMMDEEVWSKNAKSKIYWTAPAKVKAKKTGNVLRWNGVKGAKGYMIEELWKTKVGYNIFGQILTDYYLKSYFSKKKTYYFKHNIYGYYITPYAKHDGYYFMAGEAIVKRKSQLKNSDYHRIVG